MTEENSKQEGLGPRGFEVDRKVLTEADAAADLAGVPRPSMTGIMPKWKCHKTVWALKIKQITWRRLRLEDGDHALVFEDPSYAPLTVKAEYVRKHNPQPGGYYVVYADGYESYSPAKAFEEGYSPEKELGYRYTTADTPQDERQQFGGAMGGKTAQQAGPLTIDYTVLQQFAATHRAPYNELCTAVRQAIGYQPRDSNKPTVQRQPSLEERVRALEQRVIDLQRWQLSMAGKSADRDMAVAMSATPDGRLR